MKQKSSKLPHWRPKVDEKREYEQTSRKYKPQPIYINVLIRERIPRQVLSGLCNAQIDLLLKIDKYVHGYYQMGKNKRTGIGNQQAMRAWQTLPDLCSYVEQLVYKQEDFSVTKVEKRRLAQDIQQLRALKDRTKEQNKEKSNLEMELHKKRQEDRSSVRRVVKYAFKSHVLSFLPNVAESSIPLTLVSFWITCRKLHMLVSDLKYYGDEGQLVFLEAFLQCIGQLIAEEARLKQKGKEHLGGLGEILQRLLRVRNSEIEETLRIASLCTLRAISSNEEHYEPHLIISWEAHYRTWGGLTLDRQTILQGYQKAYRVRASLPEWDAQTLDFVRSYAVAAYHVFHDTRLASRLAHQLWSRTRNQLNEPGTPTWNARTQAMVDAARLRATTICVYHENMYKTTHERYHAMRQGPGWMSARAYRRYKALFPTAPNSTEAIAALDDLIQVCDYLENGKFTCLSEAAKLRESCAGFIRYFGRGNERDRAAAAAEHRSKAASRRNDIATAAASVKSKHDIYRD